MWKSSFLIILLVSLMVGSASAQIGKETDLWEWTPKSDHHASIVAILNQEKFGTGFVIEVEENTKPDEKVKWVIGKCVTAFHVISDENDNAHIGVVQNGRISFTNEWTIMSYSILAADPENDVAVIQTHVPSNIQPVKLGDSVHANEEIEIVGLGGGSKLTESRHFSSKVHRTSDTAVIRANCFFMSGDSGGPVFNKNKEVVGLNRQVWFFWEHHEVKDVTGLKATIGWPGHITSIDPIKKLIEKVNE